MQSANLPVAKLNLAFAKIVSAPTPEAWSQVYNAGSLFVVLSLSNEAQEEDQKLLPQLGKEIFSTLESEFFTLEKKDLHTVKAVIEKSFALIPPKTKASACVAFFINNILYIYIFGQGQIIMRRAQKIGVLLEKKTDYSSLIMASGLLHPGDVILLQTEGFVNNISPELLNEALKLELPIDIAESLTPHVLKKEDATLSAIIIAFNGSASTHIAIADSQNQNFSDENDASVEKNDQTASEVEMEKEYDDNENKNEHKNVKSRFAFLKKIKLPLPHITRMQKLAAIAGIVILLLLGASILFTKNAQDNAQLEALFTKVNSEAQQNYDEGMTLARLNENVARDDFLEARKVITDNLKNFPKDTEQRKKLEELLAKIENEIKDEVSNTLIKAEPASIEDNSLLSVIQKNKALAYAQDESSVYLISKDSVSTIDKQSGNQYEIFQNDGDWESPVAIGAYLGNIYILDTNEGLTKFVAAQDGFGKTDYFNDGPDLNKITDMAIDGSIWLTTTDGKILKYIRGDQDSFAITGMSKPLSPRSKLFTDIDTDSLYVLDIGNKRIIKLSKNGTFQKQFTSEVLQNATAFDISEADQKAYVLSQNKIYQLPLN